MISVLMKPRPSRPQFLGNGGSTRQLPCIRFADAVVPPAVAVVASASSGAPPGSVPDVVPPRTRPAELRIGDDVHSCPHGVANLHRLNDNY